MNITIPTLLLDNKKCWANIDSMLIKAKAANVYLVFSSE